MIGVELLSYIKKEIDDGFTKKQISEILTSSGWTILDVEEAFFSIRNPKVEYIPDTKISKNIPDEETEDKTKKDVVDNNILTTDSNLKNYEDKEDKDEEYVEKTYKSAKSIIILVILFFILIIVTYVYLYFFK